MTNFLNFTRQDGFSLNTYRKPSAQVGDLSDLLLAGLNRDEDICISVDDSIKDALQDGEYLASVTDADLTDVVEEIFNILG